MSMINLKSRHHRRRFRLFHHEKSSYIDETYSYQCMMNFPRLPITLPPFGPKLMSYRWHDDDDCDSLPKKHSRNHHHHHHQPIRRRIPKRYSDIVVPSTTKICLQQKDSTTIGEKKSFLPSSQPNRSSTNIPRRHSSKPITETVYCFNSNRKQSRETKDYYPIRHNDILAHRMQAAMSSELMHSLDRNFVFGDRKQPTNHLIMTRSHSFNICTSWNEKLERNSYHQLIPRVKIKENLQIDEPTPDYDEEIIIRTIRNENEIGEEPLADYDDPKPNIECESDDKSLTHSDLGGVSSSFIIPQTSTTNTEEQTSTPPIPPPLPNLNTEQKKITFRCRTIADKLSSDHKLILKDENEINLSGKSQLNLKQSLSPESLKTSHQIPSKPHHSYITKDFKLRKISQSLARSHSLYGSMSLLNNHETELTTLCAKKTSITDEQIQDCLSSSSPGTSTVLDNEYEHRSSSSKIYNDYKKRASLTSIPTNTTVSNSTIIHPMHTRIGLRSSTSSSSTNEKLTDMTLSSKQMNVCVINQLNEHLSTRFRKQQQQQESCSNNNTNQLSYDPPPEHMSKDNYIQSDVYDEPNDIPVVKPISSSSIPPPPPPLPVGGFRPIIPPVNRLSNLRRTSTMTLPREVKNSDVPCSTGTSTVSSNLSDTRILCELRENPIFTRAKQHLEIEPGSNGRRSGRRLIGSTSNLTNTETTVTPTTNKTVSYLRLDNCSIKSIESTIPKQLETIVMLPNELDAIIGKRTKSTHDINQTKPRPYTKSLTQTQYRQSELELIFQKRAQRSEQNLT